MLRLHSSLPQLKREKEKVVSAENVLSRDPNIGAKPARSGEVLGACVSSPALARERARCVHELDPLLAVPCPAALFQLQRLHVKAPRAMPANLHSVWVDDLMKPPESYRPSSILSPGPQTGSSTVGKGQNCASKTQVQG